MPGLLVLAGCAQGGSSGTVTDTDASRDSAGVQDTAEDTGGTPPGCFSSVERSLPEDGATDAYYRGAIEFRLNGPDPEATIVTDIPGAKSVSPDGLTVSWLPSAPLSPNTAYTATLENCNGSYTTSFRTSSLGSVVGNPAALEGAAYAVSLSEGRFVDPWPVIEPYVSIFFLDDILIEFVAVSDDTIDVRTAVSCAGQDTCVPTNDVPATFANPFVDVAPYGQAYPSRLGAYLVFEAFHLTGTLTSDGSAIGGVVATGLVDTRPLDAQFRQPEGTMCDAAAAFGEVCGACADGAQLCLPLRVDQLVASRRDVLALE